MAKRLQNNDVIGLVGTSASEWIQEIQAGSQFSLWSMALNTVWGMSSLRISCSCSGVRLGGL